MKTSEQVDAIMARIPAQWRSRWCGGEDGPCACLGCVYTGSKSVVAAEILGKPYPGDPEYISETKLADHPEIYGSHMLTRDEWSAWMARQPKA